MAVIVVIVDFSIQRLLSKHFKNWNVERWWWTQNTDNKRAKTKDIRIHTIYSVLLRTTLNIYCNAAASEQKCTHCTKRQQQQKKNRNQEPKPRLGCLFWPSMQIITLCCFVYIFCAHSIFSFIPKKEHLAFSIKC